MNNLPNYPSCIKIPSTGLKQDMTTDAKFPSKIDIKETETLFNKLVLIADRMFGERKWSHIVTNQTIDFVEPFMGKYVCGCATFIKIQLPDGVFHEDMGYCHTEATIKSVSMHYARIGSHTDAFKRVLSCFGKEIQHEIHKLLKKPKLDKIEVDTEDLGDFETLEPFAQSTPIENNKEKRPKVNATKQKSPDIWSEKTVFQPVVTKPKIAKIIEKPSENIINDALASIQSNINDQNKQSNGESEQNSKKVLTEEELLRMERKRKQMEKQAEFKRLMKEKAEQKSNKF